MGSLEVVKRFIKSSTLAEMTALNIYEWLPLSFRDRFFYGDAYINWLSLLKDADEWDKKKLDLYQFEQTKKILVHAKENIPFYREFFSDIGFSPTKMQSLSDMKTLPYLKRETVRDRALSFLDEHISPASLVKANTSGSSGIPLTLYRSREAIAAYLAFRLHILSRIGYTPKAREVMFWPMIELGKRRNLPFARFGNKLAFSIRHLTGDWLLKFYKMTQKFDAEYIFAYPSVLSIISSYIKRNSLPSIKKVKAVVTFGESLFEWQKEQIEEVFGRTFSFYSMGERAVVGGECEYTSAIHMHPAYGFVEFVDSIQGYKEIVATGLTNDIMPLVRYKTGDVVTEYSQHCSQCGRSHTIVSKVVGRTQDFLIDKNREIIPMLMTWVKTFPHVLQFQFYQEEPGRAYLQILKDKGYKDSDTSYIKLKLDEMLGLMKQGITIDIVFVDEIQLMSSGKVQMVNQKLDIRDYLMA